jgi:flagellar motor switch/type III secretory pathway protein FliN
MRLAHHLETALSQAIGSMTGKEFNVVAGENATVLPALDGAITWQQSFSVVEGPSFWISAGRDLWEALGRLTLEAAGIDEVTDEDCRSTWQEIVNQTIAGVAAGMTADQSREVTASNGAKVEVEPPDLTWLTFAVDGNGKTWAFKAAWTSDLAGLCEPKPLVVGSPVTRDSAVSKTFDLLLEVALPVAVSFGKTSLKIKEVLKLNTGSIV